MEQYEYFLTYDQYSFLFSIWRREVNNGTAYFVCSGSTIQEALTRASNWFSSDQQFEIPLLVKKRYNT